MRSEKLLLSNRRAILRRPQQSCKGQNSGRQTKTARKTKYASNAVKWAEWQVKQVAYNAECEKLRRQGVPNSQWPCPPWYPFGKKSYEQWLAEGNEPEYDDKPSFDEGPSWEVSNSEEGSAEELEFEDGD
jgi:hypothetical protein